MTELGNVRSKRETRRVDEDLLAGGVANEGRVVRIGSHVHRPAGPHASAIHNLLQSLHRAGCTGVATPVGFDEQGREVLTFLAGDVAAPPFPAWVQTDAALKSITRLLARMHNASRSFDASAHKWSGELADPHGGPVMCHNDVCIENVVFRDGEAVGLLDFDYVAPGRAVYDLAQFAKMCVPLDRAENLARLGWDRPDQVARLRSIADAYGLTRVERVELVSTIDEAMVIGAAFVERHFIAGQPGFVAMVARSGGLRRWAAQREWWADHRVEFEAVLVAGT